MIALYRIEPTSLLAAADSPGALWLTLSILAQVLIASALVSLWMAMRREGRIAAPTTFTYLGIVGALLSSIYAATRAEWVLAIGQVQVLILLLGVRILSASRTAPSQPYTERSRLPEVKPDSAEIKLTNLEAYRDRDR